MRFGPDGFLRITGKKCNLKANLGGVRVLPRFGLLPPHLVEMMNSHLYHYINRNIASQQVTWHWKLVERPFVAMSLMDGHHIGISADILCPMFLS